jgi:two-component sensor histidine kinase
VARLLPEREWLETTVIQDTGAASGTRDQGWLYVAELTHRIANEFTGAVAVARRMAAHSENSETRTALLSVCEHIGALASAYQAMRPPISDSPVDLTSHIIKLCSIMSSPALSARRIWLRVSVTEPIFVNAFLCWRAGLIVTELITNAMRHAFTEEGGVIWVSVSEGSDGITCQVRDDGRWSGVNFEPGLGSAIVTALAAELDGSVEVSFAVESGTTATLSFPLRIGELNSPPF